MGIAQVAPSGRFLAVNARLCEILGYTPAELLKLTFQDLTHIDDLPADLDHVRRLLAGEEQSYSMEKRYRRKDGALVWAQLTVSLVRDESRRPEYFVSVVQDVDARKRAEAELRRLNQELDRRVAERTTALQAAAERNRLLAAATENAGEALVVTDAAGVIQYVNPAFSLNSGYAAAEVLGRTPRVLKSGIHPEAFYREMWETILSGRVWRGEVVNRRKDGSLYTDAQCIAPVRDEAGEVTHFVVTKQDISERIRVDGALRDNEARLQSFFDAAPMMMGLLEPLADDVLHVACNQASARFTGQPTEAITGRLATELGAPRAVIELWLRHCREAERSGGPVRFEFPDGAGPRARWVSASVALVPFSPSGRPRFCYLAEDVTERRRHRERAAILRSAMDGFWVADRQGCLLEVSDAYCRLTGWTREELLLMTVADLEAAESPEQVARHIEVASQRGQDRFESRHRRKDGGLVDVEISSSYVPTDGGRFYAFVRDVTERKRAEAELRRLNAELVGQTQRAEEATRHKSGFLASMSHELRTPLNAVIGFVELLHDGKAGPLSAEQREYLGDVLTAGRHLMRVIGDVLDLARVESGRMDFHPEELDLARAIRETTDLLRVLATRKGLAVEVEVDPGVARVATDPARLKQVLFNYLSNALKVSPDGGRVTVRAAPAGSGGFRLEVADTGVGIAPNELPNLFREFAQVGGDAAQRAKGSGLGLAVTKRIVEAQGGRVGVVSEPGRGSLFWAELPQSGAATQ